MTELQDYLDSVRHRLIHEAGFEPAGAELPFALQPYCPVFLARRDPGRTWYLAMIPVASLPLGQIPEVLDQLQAHLEQNYLSGPPRHGIVALVGEEDVPVVSHPSLTVWRVNLAAEQVSREGAPIGAPRLTALDRFDPVDWDAPLDGELTTHAEPDAAPPPAAADRRPAYVTGDPWGRRRGLWNLSLFQGPWVTNLMLSAIWAIFVLMLTQTGFGAILGEFSNSTLIRWGSQYSPAIVRGQWWRLGTAMFLHGGLMHIAFNSYALYILGPALEHLFGHGRTLVMYLGAGLIASTTSFMMGSAYTNAIGASGAIFGLMGGYLYYTWYLPGAARRRLWSGIWPTLLINLVIGITVPFIDNWAHLGGLVGGFMLSAIVGLPAEKHLSARRITGVVLLALFLLWTVPTFVQLWQVTHSGLL